MYYQENKMKLFILKKNISRTLRVCWLTSIIILIHLTISLSKRDMYVCMQRNISKAKITIGAKIIVPFFRDVAPIFFLFFFSYNQSFPRENYRLYDLFRSLYDSVVCSLGAVVMDFNCYTGVYSSISTQGDSLGK